VSERTSEDHPRDRWSDRHTGWKRVPAWFWHHKLYRDIWLVIITIVLYGAVQANQDRVDDIQANRVSQTHTVCERNNDIIRGYNDGQDFLAKIIVSGVLAAGDTPVPKGEKDPFKWTAIKDGPLSKSIQRQIPGYPNGTVRLATAKKQANEVRNKKIALRNCALDTQKVKHLDPPKKEGNG
jgi:hypothetical protein